MCVCMEQCVCAFYWQRGARAIGRAVEACALWVMVLVRDARGISRVSCMAMCLCIGGVLCVARQPRTVGLSRRHSERGAGTCVIL